MITEVDLAADVEAALRANHVLDVDCLQQFCSGRLRSNSPVAGALAARGFDVDHLQLFGVVSSSEGVQLLPRLANMLAFLQCTGVLERGGDFMVEQGEAIRAGTVRYLRTLLADAETNSFITAQLLDCKYSHDVEWDYALPGLTCESVVDSDEWGYVHIVKQPATAVHVKAAATTAAGAASCAVVEGAAASLPPARPGESPAARAVIRPLPLTDVAITSATVEALLANLDPAVSSISALALAFLKTGVLVQDAYAAGVLLPWISAPREALCLFSIYKQENSRDVCVMPRLPFMAKFLQWAGVLARASDLHDSSPVYGAVCMGVRRYIQHVLQTPAVNASVVASLLDKMRCDIRWARVLPSLTAESWLSVDDTGRFVAHAPATAVSTTASDASCGVTTAHVSSAIAPAAANTVAGRTTSQQTRQIAVQLRGTCDINLIRLADRCQMVAEFVPDDGAAASVQASACTAAAGERCGADHDLAICNAVAPAASGWHWCAPDAGLGRLTLFMEPLPHSGERSVAMCTEAGSLATSSSPASSTVSPASATDSEDAPRPESPAGVRSLADTFDAVMAEASPAACDSGIQVVSAGAASVPSDAIPQRGGSAVE